VSDLFEDPDAGANAPEFTVSEISGAVKRSIEGAFGHVRVRGEVGRVSRPSSGHFYLDLKDDRSVLASVIWKGQVGRLEVRPEEGMEVIATGRLTTFPGQSRYQMVIEQMAPAGMGALMAMLDKRRRALEAEGLFAPERKRPLPFLPEIIGVVTSPSGAVIRDILHRLRDRFPRKVLIWPVAVQGQACAPEVARAIRGFNRLTPGGALPRPDVLIVARGGGSVEDLWGFNEEIVVRAAAASEIPLISAVGHETDTTLIDFASDRRAPTPTAAAEMAVPVRMELLAAIRQSGGRLERAAARGVELRGQRLRDLSRALPRPETLVENAGQRLDLAGTRLPRALSHLVRDRRATLTRAAAALSPRHLSARTATEAGRLDALSRRLETGLNRATERAATRLAALSDRLPRAGAAQSSRRRMAFDALGRRLSLPALQRDLARQSQGLRNSAARLPRAGQLAVSAHRTRLDATGRLLASLGHKSVLSRGYALIRDAEGALVTSRAAAETRNRLQVEFADGRLDVLPADGPEIPPAKPRRKAAKPKQGTLFDE